jgi:hypothetical protein
MRAPFPGLRVIPCRIAGWMPPGYGSMVRTFRGPLITANANLSGPVA